MKKMKIISTIVILLGISIAVVNNISEKQQIYQEALDKGIYEFDNSVEFFLPKNKVYAHYMVCNPPESDEELKKMVDDFVEKNNIIEEIKERTKEKIKEKMPGATQNLTQYFTITLTFYRPSKKFPIGWQPYSKTVFSGGEIGENAILSMWTKMDGSEDFEYSYYRYRAPWNSFSYD